MGRLSPLFDLAQPFRGRKEGIAFLPLCSCVCVCVCAAAAVLAGCAVPWPHLIYWKKMEPPQPVQPAVPAVAAGGGDGSAPTQAGHVAEANSFASGAPPQQPASTQDQLPTPAAASGPGQHAQNKPFDPIEGKGHACSKPSSCRNTTHTLAHTAALKVGGLRLANIIRAKAPPAAGSAGQLQAQQQQAGGGGEGAVVMARLKATAAG